MEHSRGLTHKQPNHETSPLDGDTDWYDRNTNIPQVDGMARTELPQPAVKGRTPNYVGPDGKHNFPNLEKNWDVNLKKPRQPVQNQNPDGNSYTGAI